MTKRMVFIALFFWLGMTVQAQEAAQKLVEIYRGELGVREATGKNDGARVEEYLAAVGLKKGQPWCASFVCWALGKAGLPHPRSGWSPDLFPAARLIWQRGKGVLSNPSSGKREAPTAGDVFGIYFPEKGRIAHAGFVDQWQEKYLITVEGNTTEAGSREGDGVYRKRRLISSIYKVARWK